MTRFWWRIFAQTTCVISVMFSTLGYSASSSKDSAHGDNDQDYQLVNFQFDEFFKQIFGDSGKSGEYPLRVFDGTIFITHDQRNCQAEGDQEVKVLSTEATAHPQQIKLNLDRPIVGCDARNIVVTQEVLSMLKSHPQQITRTPHPRRTQRRSQPTNQSLPKKTDPPNLHLPLIQVKNNVKPTYVFPLAHPPLDEFTKDGREFGAPRGYGRLHAGVDLLEYPGQAVYAITDGRVVNYQYFYEGTYVLTIDHHEFVVRYGEIMKMYGSLKVGDKVSGGDKIALVGLMNNGSSMLHLEKYSGKLSGPFSVSSAYPYQRRGDLVNPTSFIRSLTGSYPNSS